MHNYFYFLNVNNLREAKEKMAEMLTIKVTIRCIWKLWALCPQVSQRTTLFSESQVSFAWQVTSVVQTCQLCNKGLDSWSVNPHAIKILHLTVSSGLGES